jgi:outer membrane protein assembly factor BamB
MFEKDMLKSRKPMVWGVFCLLLWAMAPAAGVFAADPGAGATGKPQASAKDLVQQLSGDSYKAREKAQKALIAMGADALDAVAAGAKSTDPETRSRCEQILIEIQKNLLATRTEAIGKNIVWKSPLDSAPAGETVIVKGLALLTDSEGVLHALDPATGKEKWHCDAQPGQFTGAAPALDDTTAYLDCGRGNANFHPARSVAAIELATGKLLWKTEGAMGEISPPALADGVVYVCGKERRVPVAKPGAPVANNPAGGYFEALDAKSGKSLWKLSLGVNLVRPAIGKGLAFVSGEDLKVHAIDLKTHKEAWASEASRNAALAMRVEGQRLLVQSLMAVVALDADTGKQAWSLDLPNDTANQGFINGGQFRMTVMVNGRVMTSGQGQGERTFCVTDGTAYLPCGQKVWAVETKSGQKQWEYEAPQNNAQGNLGGGRMGGGGMIQGGGQIIVNGNGRMIINGRMFGGGAGQDYQPVVAGGAIYYGASDGLHAVDLRTRQETWVLHTPGPVCTRPVVSGGVIYFGVDSSAPALPMGIPGMAGVAPGVAPGAGGQAAPAPAQSEKLPALYAVKLPVK